MYQESSWDPLSSVCAAPPHKFPGLQGRLFPTFLHLYLWVPQSPHLLCQSIPHHAFFPLNIWELATSQSHAWRALCRVSHMHRKESASKTQLFSLAAYIFDSPSEIQFAQLLNLLARIWWNGEILDSYNSTSFTKTSDYILETKFLSHVSTTAATIAAVSTPHLFALKQPPHNWDLTYDPSIWKELLLKLAVNSEVQTSSRPATVTCLHPNAGLFVLAPALGYAALSLRCQHNQSWIWTQKKRYLV